MDEYDEDPLGDEPLRPPEIRSLNNDHVAAVRFINRTRYDVELLWINYEGHAVSYGRLAPGKEKCMSTYATHPWIFVEPVTRDRFLAGGKEVYYPEPWFVKYRHLPRSEMPRRPRIVADPVYISIPMYSLRQTAMRFIKSRLIDDEDALTLEIPANLQRELFYMEPRKHGTSDRNFYLSGVACGLLPPL